MAKRATKQQIAVTVGLFLAVAAAGFYWAPHIRWSYLLTRNSIKVAPVKVRDMPAATPSPDWFVCRAGALSLSLPATMAEEAERSVATAAPHSLTLTTPTHEITLMIPHEYPEGSQPILSRIAASMNVSPTQLVAESYRASTDDFRWTMSHGELLRHEKLLELWYLYPHRAVDVVETWYGDALGGLLILHEDKSHAIYQWQLNSGQAAGFVQFSAKQGALDYNEVRAVCRSVTCDESRLGPELSKDQLGVLADTMQIELEALPASEEKLKNEN